MNPSTCNSDKPPTKFFEESFNIEASKSRAKNAIEYFRFKNYGFSPDSLSNIIAGSDEGETCVLGDNGFLSELSVLPVYSCADPYEYPIIITLVPQDSCQLEITIAASKELLDRSVDEGCLVCLGTCETSPRPVLERDSVVKAYLESLSQTLKEAFTPPHSPGIPLALDEQHGGDVLPEVKESLPIKQGAIASADSPHAPAATGKRGQYGPQDWIAIFEPIKRAGNVHPDYVAIGKSIDRKPSYVKKQWNQYRNGLLKVDIEGDDSIP